jgi:hypothetical protein
MAEAAPPQVLSIEVPRRELREALRKAKGFALKDSEIQVHLFADKECLVLEAGDYRHRLAVVGEWRGCVSVDANVLLPFWNALPKSTLLTLTYTNGWLQIEGLSVGLATWTPKYETDWMSEK